MTVCSDENGIEVSILVTQCVQDRRTWQPVGLETTVQRPTVHKAGIIRRVGLRREWPLDDRPEVDGLAGVSGLTHWRSRGYIGSDR
jgi:hypothetical protein